MPPSRSAMAESSPILNDSTPSTFAGAAAATGASAGAAGGGASSFLEQAAISDAAATTMKGERIRGESRSMGTPVFGKQREGAFYTTGDECRQRARKRECALFGPVVPRPSRQIVLEERVA